MEGEDEQRAVEDEDGGKMLMLSHLFLINLNCFKEATKVYIEISFRLNHGYKYSLNSLKTAK